MADLRDDEDDQPTQEIIGAAAEGPDLSDLETVIFSIQQRDGQQFSLIVAREDGMTLSLTSDHEGDMEEIHGDDEVVRTVFSGPQVWEFVIRLE